MQEQHGLAVGADLELVTTNHACAFSHQSVTRLFDVWHLVAEMVDAAIWIALEEAGDRRFLAEQTEELDLGIRQLDEHCGHAVLGLIDLRSEERRVGKECRSRWSPYH